MILRSDRPVAHHFSDESGKTYSEAYFDGYPVGDRLLEGVAFKCVIHPDKHLTVETAEDARAYMEDLNERRWLEAVLNYVVRKADWFYELPGLSGEELCLDRV